MSKITTRIKKFDKYLDSITPFFLILLFSVLLFVPRLTEPLWNPIEVEYLLSQSVTESFKSFFYIPFPLFFMKIPLSVISIRVLMIVQILLIESLLFILIVKATKNNVIAYCFLLFFLVFLIRLIAGNQSVITYYSNWKQYVTGTLTKQDYLFSFSTSPENTYKILKVLYNQKKI